VQDDQERTLRVLTVVDAFRLGGAETLIAQLGRVAAEADLELQVLSILDRGPDRSALEPLLRDVGLEPQYLGVTRTLDPTAVPRLVSFIRRSGADVVHAHLEMAMTLALPAAALAGRPGVGTFHHVHRPLSGRAALRERLAVEVATRSKAAIFVSQASLTSFADRYRPGRRVPKSWTVVHNGIDLDYFSPPTEASPAFPAHLGLPSDLGLSGSAPSGGYRVVTLLAALRDFKGITHAVRAWPDVLARVPEARLLLVGSGSEEASLRSQVADLGLTESVVFAGMRSDIPEVLRASEVVLLPSIYGENLPTVLMEAGGCGRPVVASDVGGISDIVADRETGLLVRPGDAAGIADAVVRLLDDPDLAESMGRAGRQRMERLFDAHGWAANLRRVYATAMGSSRQEAIA
jgi:glycosyltransferase involved in cell wall biosynthesis